MDDKSNDLERLNSVDPYAQNEVDQKELEDRQTQAKKNNDTGRLGQLLVQSMISSGLLGGSSVSGFVDTVNNMRQNASTVGLTEQEQERLANPSEVLENAVLGRSGDEFADSFFEQFKKFVRYTESKLINVDDFDRAFNEVADTWQILPYLSDYARASLRRKILSKVATYNQRINEENRAQQTTTDGAQEPNYTALDRELGLGGQGLQNEDGDQLERDYDRGAPIDAGLAAGLAGAGGAAVGSGLLSPGQYDNADLQAQRAREARVAESQGQATNTSGTVANQAPNQPGQPQSDFGGQPTGSAGQYPNDSTSKSNTEPNQSSEGYGEPGETDSDQADSTSADQGSDYNATTSQNSYRPSSRKNTASDQSTQPASSGSDVEAEENLEDSLDKVQSSASESQPPSQSSSSSSSKSSPSQFSEQNRQALKDDQSDDSTTSSIDKAKDAKRILDRSKMKKPAQPTDVSDLKNTAGRSKLSPNQIQNAAKQTGEAAKKAGQVAANTAKSAAGAASNAAGAALAAAGEAIAGASAAVVASGGWIIAIILAVILIIIAVISLIAGVTVYTYCTPDEQLRERLETSLLSAEKPIQGYVNQVEREYELEGNSNKSIIREFLEKNICPPKDSCGPNGSGDLGSGGYKGTSATGVQALAMSGGNCKLRALMRTIANWEEFKGGDPYKSKFPSKSFTGDYHPATIESSGGYTSDAAGRYQFLSTTWLAWALDGNLVTDSSARGQIQTSLDDCRRFGETSATCAGALAVATKLVKFTPENQDLAIYRFLERQGIIPLLESGQFDKAACSLAVQQWASSPCGTQSPKSMGEYRALYDKLVAEECGTPATTNTGSAYLDLEKINPLQILGPVQANAQTVATGSANPDRFRWFPEGNAFDLESLRANGRFTRSDSSGGVDFTIAPPGKGYEGSRNTPIVAHLSGEVTYIDNPGPQSTSFGSYGNVVGVYYPSLGITAVYAHLESINVKPGDSVSPGTLLGRQGSSGSSRGNTPDGTFIHVDLRLVRGKATTGLNASSTTDSLPGSDNAYNVFVLGMADYYNANEQKILGNDFSATIASGSSENCSCPPALSSFIRSNEVKQNSSQALAFNPLQIFTGVAASAQQNNTTNNSTTNNTNTTNNNTTTTTTTTTTTQTTGGGGCAVQNSGLTNPGGFIRPSTGVFTACFGQPGGIDPKSGKECVRHGPRGHKGIDIGDDSGTDIVASADGVVNYAQFNDGGYGYLVVLTHSNGYETLYGHNSELLVKVGQQVKQGDIIAKMGSTGYSTGPHVHFEIIKSGAAEDPCKYISCPPIDGNFT